MNATDAKRIACGNRKAHGFTPGFQHHHASTAEVRQCFTSEFGLSSLEEDEQHAIEAEVDPDQAYERHLENAGWAEARAQEEHEAAMGVVSFEEAFASAMGHGVARRADGSLHLPDEDGMPGLEIGPKAVQPPLASLPVTKPDFQGLPDGIYTVETESGHRTFQVKTQKTDAKFAPGQRILSVLSGPSNTSDYIGLGFVSTNARGEHILRPWKKHRDSSPETQAAAATLLADPRSALTAGKCARCQRPLTTPESLTRGLGEYCAGKMGV